MTDWSGEIAALHLCARASQPMVAMDALSLVAGHGIEGDRYMLGTGYYSNKPEDGRHITLFEIESLQALLRDYDIALSPAEHRRNATVRGVPLNHLVGRRFRMGATLLEATRLSIPCRYIEELTGKAIFKPLMHRSGLNCKILEGGVVRVGDVLAPAQ